MIRAGRQKASRQCTGARATKRHRNCIHRHPCQKTGHNGKRLNLDVDKVNLDKDPPPPSVVARHAVAQIPGEFEALSEEERQQLRRALVERVPMSCLTDDDFAALAAASFRGLNEETVREG